MDEKLGWDFLIKRLGGLFFRLVAAIKMPVYLSGSLLKYKTVCLLLKIWKIEVYVS